MVEESREKETKLFDENSKETPSFDDKFESKVTEWKSYAKSKDGQSKLFDEDLLNNPVIDSNENESNRTIQVNPHETHEYLVADGYFVDGGSPVKTNKTSSSTHIESRRKHSNLASHPSIFSDGLHSDLFEDSKRPKNEIKSSSMDRPPAHSILDYTEERENTNHVCCHVHTPPRPTVVPACVDISSIHGKVVPRTKEKEVVHIKDKTVGNAQNTSILTSTLDDQASAQREIIANLEAKIQSLEKANDNLRSALDASENMVDDLKIQLEMVSHNTVDLDRDHIKKKLELALKLVEKIRNDRVSEDVRSELNRVKLENIKLKSIIEELTLRLKNKIE